MKQLLALCLSLCLLLSLSACQQPSTTQTPTESGSAAGSTSANTDPADASTDPADLSQLLEQGLTDPGASSSAEPLPEASEPEEPVQRDARTFGLSMPKDATLVQTATAEELQRQVEAMGDSLIVAEASETAEAQQEQLQKLAEQKVAAIFLCPVDGNALEDTLAALAQQELPVFGFGQWDFQPDGVISIIRSDDYNAGYVCGMDLAGRFPKGGDVVVLERNDSDALMQRAQGFIAAAEESGVDLEIVDEIELDKSPKHTAETAEKALQEDSELVAIFTASDRDAEGALAAVEGKTCLVYSGDGSPALKAKLGNSQLAGLGAQSPVGMADALIDNANEHLDGEAVEAEPTVGTFLINEKNLKKYGVEGWQ